MALSWGEVGWTAGPRGGGGPVGAWIDNVAPSIGVSGVPTPRSPHIAQSATKRWSESRPAPIHWYAFAFTFHSIYGT